MDPPGRAHEGRSRTPGPLSAPALAVLDRMREQGGDFIFPGLKPGKSLSDMAMLNLIGRMNGDRRQAGLACYVDPSGAMPKSHHMASGRRFVIGRPSARTSRAKSSKWRSRTRSTTRSRRPTAAATCLTSVGGSCPHGRTSAAKARHRARTWWRYIGINFVNRVSGVFFEGAQRRHRGADGSCIPLGADIGYEPTVGSTDGFQEARAWRRKRNWKLTFSSCCWANERIPANQTLGAATAT